MKQQKQNKSIFKRLPLLLIILALVVVAGVLVFLFVINKTTHPVKYRVSQVVGLQKVMFEEGVILEESEIGAYIRSVKAGETNSVDTSPLYFEEFEQLLIPVDMVWMDPENSIEFKFDARTEIYRGEDNMLHAKLDHMVLDLPGGFLYRGSNQYIFLEKTTIFYDGFTYEVEPLSFYDLKAGHARLYSYADGQLVNLKPEKPSLRAEASTNKGYRIDLKAGAYYSSDGNRMLLRPTPDSLTSVWDLE